MYDIKDYHFELAESLIAQTPSKKRDESRLLCVDRKTGETQDCIFKDFPDFLREGDLLVLNDTKVIPARLKGHRPTGGAVELFLVRPENEQDWVCLVKPSRKLTVGSKVILKDGVRAQVLQDLGGSYRLVHFEVDALKDHLSRLGDIPLPPYICREITEEDTIRYQTLYAKQEGAVAAPTAGLHFSEGVFVALKKKAVKVATVTLHVGPGTFKPISVTDIRKHAVDPEYFEVPEETMALIKQTKEASGRVISVGTTTTRVLETLAKNSDVYSGWTETYIYPPYQFQMVDVMLTNFHLPESSLLLLVGAFMGKDKLFEVYRHAIQKSYRFYSYGDAMLIL